LLENQINVNFKCSRATTELPEKVTPKCIPSQLWPPKSTEYNPIHYSVWDYWERRCTEHASVGTTVFRGPRNFEPSRGIWPLPRNFYVSAEFHGIRGNSVERPNSVILYCCCNCICDSQSIHRQLQRPVDFSDVF